MTTITASNTQANISARKLAIFSLNVARQRKVADITKTEYASYSGVSRDTIRRIENRPAGYKPSVNTIQALAFVLGTSVGDALTKRLSFQ